MKNKNKPKPTKYWAFHCKRMKAVKKVIESAPPVNFKNSGALGICGNRTPELARIIQEAAK